MQRHKMFDWSCLFTWALVFETASSKVSDHLFSMTHLPKAQIPWKYELLLKPTLLLSHLHPHNAACPHTHTHARTRAHVQACLHVRTRCTCTLAHLQKHALALTVCGSECCSCMSSRVELCGEDLWSQPGSLPTSPLFAFSLLGLLPSWPLTSFRCRLQR